MNDRGVERSDGVVIEQSLAQPTAFATLFDRHYRQIWSYACRRAGPTVADEVASETFVRAFAGRTRYDRSHQRSMEWPRHPAAPTACSRVPPAASPASERA